MLSGKTSATKYSQEKSGIQTSKTKQHKWKVVLETRYCGNTKMLEEGLLWTAVASWRSFMQKVVSEVGFKGWVQTQSVEIILCQGGPWFEEKPVGKEYMGCCRQWMGHDWPS
jgi:hypothetical protein